MFRDGKPNDFPNTVSSWRVLGSVCICYLGATGENVVWRVRRSIQFAGSPGLDILCIGTHIPYGDVYIRACTLEFHLDHLRKTYIRENRAVFYVSFSCFLYLILILILLRRSFPKLSFPFHLFSFCHMLSWRL